MAYTHTIKLDFEKDGETQTFFENYAFKNGKEAGSQPISGAPNMSLEAWDEWAHVKQHLNMLKHRLEADNIEVELIKK